MYETIANSNSDVPVPGVMGGGGGGGGFRLEERDRVLPEMCKYVCDTIFMKSGNSNEKSFD